MPTVLAQQAYRKNKMSIMSPAERRTIVEEFNDTHNAALLGHCLPKLLERTAKAHLGKTALICAGTEITYGELNTRANRFAHVLVERGIGRGDLVGVALDRSIDVVVVLVAVLKSGAAYVPIDPTLPTERMRHMMADALPKLIVAAGGTIDVLTSLGGVCLGIDEVHDNMNSEKNEGGNLEVALQPEDVAYVMYTSGSTGRPKGVEISHGAISNFVLAMQQNRGCSENGRILAITTISFDMMGYELWVPLVCGSTTVIAQTHQLKDARALLELMKQNAVTMMIGTPTTWQMLIDSGWRGQPRLESIMCGGEKFSQQLAERLLEYGDTVWNQYGPAEATVCASVWKVLQGKDMIIGNPLPNVRLYVLDTNLSPVPVGSSGELYIGGAGVARGYRNNSELTQSRFLNNPFHEGRLYRTGDMARFLAPDRLVLLGRADSQIKIRGHRIEPGDVEAAITTYDEVSTAVVISREGRLVAYFVRDTHCCRPEPAQGVEAALPDRLRSWLGERLPTYMVPSFFVELDAFPVSLNGKIDRKGLPDPVAQVQAPIALRPTEPMERCIFDIWSRVIGHDRIGINDNFFHIGGDSARAVRVQTELVELLNKPVSTAKLFEHYTIKSLAAYLVGENTSDSEASLAFRPRASATNGEMIAIVSTSCRLPGITTPEEFWKLLDIGGDVITDVPRDRWDADAIYDADPATPGKSYCRRGGFIDSIDSFDHSFFGISPREARRLDPMQYMMLETCWEGFERAGYTTNQLRGSQTGVFIGISNAPDYPCYYATDTSKLEDLDGYVGTGSAGSTMSGRISYTLGLEGPALTVDTACSSSLVATHLACMSLRQGECDMAVAGGVSLMLTPGLHVEFSRLQGMSTDGRCRTFAADTQGTGWGEGCAAVVLKRLSDAQRDGDTILAVLRGTAVNHGGRSSGLTVPSGPAQRRLVHTALASSSLEPGDIDYIEAHGTGTKLGDPIEGMALAECFGGSHSNTSPLWIGSAKSNVGHTQAAAGLVGLLKVVLAMRHNVLPKTLHVTEPTPAVDWNRAPMKLVQENRPWLSSADRRRRAGVSAFGVGGTNAHVVVEEAPPLEFVADEDDVEWAPSSAMKVPVLLSGHTKMALLQQAEKLHRHLHGKATDWRLIDVASSLATTRNHFRRRLVWMVKDRDELLYRLSNIGPNSVASCSPVGEPRLAMLFTGQGSQFSGMGRELADRHSIFREALHDVSRHFEGLLDRPLLEVMWAELDETTHNILMERTDYAQPALFALQVALWRLWKSWGVQPDIVLGHSVGELAAAHVAGIMNISDACHLVAARGRLMQALPAMRGAMASLEASVVEVDAAIGILDMKGYVSVACQNTPTQTVASGDVEAVEKLITYFDSQGHKSKMLEVPRAFHSHHMDAMMSAFHTAAEKVKFRSPTLALVSSLTGKLAEPGQLEVPAYWVQQARQAVLFSDAVQNLAVQGTNIFIELGPRPLLCGMGVECVGSLVDRSNATSAVWLPSLVPGKEDSVVIQDSLAQLHLRHVPVDWSVYFRPFGCQRIELPTYAFQRERVRQRTDNTRTNGNSVLTNKNENDSISADTSHFEIDWSPMKENTTVRHGGAGYKYQWGLMCPADEAPWASEIETALSRADIQLLLVSQLKDATKLAGLLCLWHSDADVDIVQQARHLTAKALVHLQAAVKTHFSPPIVWVTRNAIGAQRTDEPAGLGAGPLWGLMRTARIEHPGLRLRLIDVDEKCSASHTLASALALKDEPECALRQQSVLVPRMQLVPPSSILPAQPKTTPLLRKDGAVLITGGLGNIGQLVARWLVKAHGIRDLVLTSRRGMQTPGAAALVEELSQLGAKVNVIAGNIGDFDSARAIIEMFTDQTSRPLRGVVHTAGILDDGVLSALTPPRFNAVFEPKVEGAWHLHQLTQTMNLDLFVVFSSLSGVVGNAGQANYAAANTFLDSLAQLRIGRGLPATSIAWGLWGGNGMGGGLSPAVRARYSRIGINPLSPTHGLHLLEQAVHRGRSLAVPVAYDLPKLRNSQLNDEGSIPPLFQSLLSDIDNKDSRQQISKEVERSEDLRETLSKAPRERHQAIVLQKTRQVVAKTLGFDSANDLDVHLPLHSIGLDSLTAVLARNHLASAMGLTLSARIVFDHPNLKALSEFLLSQLRSCQTNGSSKTPSGYDMTNNVSKSSCGDSPSLDLAAISKGCLDSTFTFNKAAQGHRRPESVFVTGATGFVGAFIVHELLEREVSVHCLVRGNTVDQARQRLVNILDSYGLWKAQYSKLLYVVGGDMAQPRLGLSKEVFDSLADRVDAICHSGALVDWMRPMEDYIGPNLVSTHEVLRLASTGHRSKTVHFVSTVATIPRYLGYDVSVDEYEYCYATSKYMAERMVAAARWRGAQASIYRIPYVTASNSTGHFRLDQGDFLHNLIAGSIEMGCFPSLGGNLSIVLPVDYLCKTIVNVATHDLSRIGQDFDFANPQAPSFDEFFQGMITAGTGNEVVRYSIWRERALAYAATHPTSHPARIAAVLDSCSSDEDAAAMFKAPPLGEHVFGSEDYAAPPVNQRSIRTYLDRIRIAREKSLVNRSS